MNYTIETSPDIGNGIENEVYNGTYNISISNLDYGISYTWYVNVTDGTHWTNKTFNFKFKERNCNYWRTKYNRYRRCSI